MVVFFCAKPTPSTWEYFFIGFGTVRASLAREEIWREPTLEPYRRFYNILGRPSHGGLAQHEDFYPFHVDWGKRLSAPYILFEPGVGLTHFNLSNPLHVATYVRGGQVPEQWHARGDRLVRHLEQLLFTAPGIRRRLRTSPTRFAHAHLSLHTWLERRDLLILRDELSNLLP
jgi:hypothetical protein